MGVKHFSTLQPVPVLDYWSSFRYSSQIILNNSNNWWVNNSIPGRKLEHSDESTTNRTKPGQAVSSEMLLKQL